jgi:hypothetical protein
MEQKEALLRLAEDVEFLRKYIIHPNLDLELRVKELEKINSKLREICRILAEDRIIIKKEIAQKTERLGGYSEKIKVLQKKLLNKENLLARMALQIKSYKEIIVSLRNKNIDLGIDEKQREEKLEEMGKTVRHAKSEKIAFLTRLAETKKALDIQIRAVRKQKNLEAMNKKELEERLLKVLPLLEKQNEMLEDVKQELNEKLAEQKKHYQTLMAELNQRQVREMIDKKALIMSMKNRIEELKQEIDSRKKREQELIERFGEKLKELFNE